MGPGVKVGVGALTKKGQGPAREKKEIGGIFDREGTKRSGTLKRPQKRKNWGKKVRKTLPKQFKRSRESSIRHGRMAFGRGSGGGGGRL